MYKDPPAWDRINSFALVTYIPEPLAGFLDRLRQELVPNCFLRAHVTMLPPRPLGSTPEAAWEVVKSLVPRFAPFDIHLGNIDIFPVSDVIYVNVTTGREELKQMHEALNVDGFKCKEDFPYHPHVTLAQELKPDEVDELVSVARSRWVESNMQKTFRAEKMIFVQNTRRNQWVDLGECELGCGESKLVGEMR